MPHLVLFSETAYSSVFWKLNSKYFCFSAGLRRSIVGPFDPLIAGDLDENILAVGSHSGSRLDPGHRRCGGRRQAFRRGQVFGHAAPGHAALFGRRAERHQGSAGGSRSRASAAQALVDGPSRRSRGRPRPGRTGLPPGFWRGARFDADDRAAGDGRDGGYWHRHASPGRRAGVGDGWRWRSAIRRGRCRQCASAAACRSIAGAAFRFRQCISAAARRSIPDAGFRFRSTGEHQRPHPGRLRRCRLRAQRQSELHSTAGGQRCREP